MKTSRMALVIIFALVICLAGPRMIKTLLTVPSVGNSNSIIEVNINKTEQASRLPGHAYCIGTFGFDCFGSWLNASRLYSFSTSTEHMRELGTLKFGERTIDLFKEKQESTNVVFTWDRHLRVGKWETLWPCLVPPMSGRLDFYDGTGRHFLDLNRDGLIDRFDQYSNPDLGFTWKDTDFDGIFDIEYQFSETGGETRHRSIRIPIPIVAD